jgi:hypothetical protein
MFLTANTHRFSRGVGPFVYPALMGYISICKQHERFCTGANAQFSSYRDCEWFMQELVQKPAFCGPAAIVSGNTVACRAKHQFMAQINPDRHCQHIGIIKLTQVEILKLAMTVNANSLDWQVQSI